MSSYALAAAAVLSVFTGVVHSWLGEVKLITPMLAAGHRHRILEKSEFARRVIRFAWHVTSIAWWGFAVILAGFATGPLQGHDRWVLIVIAAMFGLTGLITLIASRGRHLAWPIFLAIAGLTLTPLV